MVLEEQPQHAPLKLKKNTNVKIRSSLYLTKEAQETWKYYIKTEKGKCCITDEDKSSRKKN